MDDENFRHRFLTLPEAVAELEDIFGDLAADEAQGDVLWAITAVGGFTRRRSLDDLSARTRRDYLGSHVAREEAAMYGLSVARWYELAPNLKAFRRKVRQPQRFRPDERSFKTYVARDSGEVGLPQPDKERYSEAFRAAWGARKAAA